VCDGIDVALLKWGQAIAVGIPAIHHHEIPRPEGEMLHVFCRVVIRQHELVDLASDQVEGEMEPEVIAGSPSPTETVGIHQQHPSAGICCPSQRGVER
jgi:hypothetical protein